MTYKPLKIIFQLDGTGLYFDTAEPIHFDALLAWCLAPYHCKGEPPGRDEDPFDIPLPLDKWYIGSEWGWKASALFPEGKTAADLQFWRKKFRQSRIEFTKGSPSLTNGVYREYNVPLPLLLCRYMVCYVVGDAKRIRHILKKHIKCLGKKAAYGKGRVIGIEVEKTDNDFSMIKDGAAMRYLPKRGGLRSSRIRPPYWNNCNRVECCEVGDDYESYTSS